jgi:hypothetical protein
VGKKLKIFLVLKQVLHIVKKVKKSKAIPLTGRGGL